MLCLSKSRARRGLAARMLVVRFERVASLDRDAASAERSRATVHAAARTSVFVAGRSLLECAGLLVVVAVVAAFVVVAVVAKFVVVAVVVTARVAAAKAGAKIAGGGR
jgi:hypothetical protein